MDSQQFDVVVIGSGSAGLTAAVVAARSGLSVALVEKSRYFGGTSAWSGGGCWLPANPLAASVGITDNVDDATQYVQGAVGMFLKRDLFDAFLRNCNAMLAFLLQNSEVRFFPRNPAPDWRGSVPGAKAGGRSLASPTYDGRSLGAEMLRKLQPPLRSFNAPMGMMMSPLDFMHAMKMRRSWTSLRYMIGVVGRYARDLMIYGRGSRLTMGNALVARLLKSAMDAGVTLWNDTPASRMERTGGVVTGVVVCRNGRDMLLSAHRGIVLASGGFSANTEMRDLYCHAGSDHITMATAGSQGDGIKMALPLGAVMETANAQPMAWDVVSRLDGSTDVNDRCLHFFTDLPKPGNIVVGPDGRRFGNEANHQLGKAMVAAGLRAGWIVCDHRAIRKYGVGLVWPYAINLSSLERRGYVRSAPTIAALAQMIGLSGPALAETVERFNEFATKGLDPDFGRGAELIDRANGDPAHTPNPCLGPLDQAPFHAVQIFLGDVGSVAGLQVDDHARVLDAMGAPIERLFACGLDMNSLWAGLPIGAGMNHAHNMTFAYIAARTMAGAND